ncbi:hypothetical protein [Mycolicibacterium peregrinum]|uniref:hypothetical protein n=1 Tax=Mycolicibacterium peregrinum TaxID=43304 RepID=UPI0006D8491A|nr:hypothetical protein [Mycolicibacterium peregrinum]ORW62631.1 hypothetical protein AWC21_04445 [Mycolicibacterium peregrinum]
MNSYLPEFGHLVLGAAHPTTNGFLEQGGEPGLVEGRPVGTVAGPHERLGRLGAGAALASIGPQGGVGLHQRAAEVEERRNVLASRSGVHSFDELLEHARRGCLHAGNGAVRR